MKWRINEPPTEKTNLTPENPILRYFAFGQELPEDKIKRDSAFWSHTEHRPSTGRLNCDSTFLKLPWPVLRWSVFSWGSSNGLQPVTTKTTFSFFGQSVHSCGMLMVTIDTHTFRAPVITLRLDKIRTDPENHGKGCVCIFTCYAYQWMDLGCMPSWSWVSSYPLCTMAALLSPSERDQQT